MAWIKDINIPFLTAFFRAWAEDLDIPDSDKSPESEKIESNERKRNDGKQYL
ncbi:MAG: hypothetical protein J5685_08960 [Clostridiales bacterium]|nr:hypothetical protein [Clostridiales bacterium]